MKKMDNLKFRISTGLKNIIGRELITDKFIAIFELVKNSYDAGANRVDITFDNIYSYDGTITISDNGCGMDEDDIINKWLFVAYSEKSSKRSGTYRDEYTKRAYAGAKGIGRFSCDRLGSKLDLYSRKVATQQVNLLSVDWNKFEEDAQEEFVDIPVNHQYVESLPSKEESGTSVVVRELREAWDRVSLLDLKKSLAKLVNPYEDKNNSFSIYIFCEDEKNKDEKLPYKDRVNGRIDNYIFETLNLKTTQISVTISETGDTITTKMFDRDTFLFELTQESKYISIKNVNIELFYLNRAAKYSFTKLMGMQPVKFGSIFIYKNGFRVMPYGEPGADTFEIDRRKQQGYNRFLGTRDLMGRVVILGDNPDFVETSSRAGGFISTKAFEELSNFYMDFAHKPLEKYVVELIDWGDVGKNGEAEITPESIKNDIIKYITSYERKGAVITLDINPDLVDIVDERKNKQNESDIDTLKSVARQYKDAELDKLAHKVELENQQLKRERQALASHAEKVSETLENKNAELQATKKQALFLRGIANPRIENATTALHSINTYAQSIKKNIDKVIHEINKSADQSLKEKISSNLFDIIKATQKINGTFTIALKADYDMSYQTINMNVYDFINQFVNDAFMTKTGNFIDVKISAPVGNVEANINPTEFGIVIENIIYNSFKARAKNLNISILESNSCVEIIFTDDGVGLNKSISDPERIFELGFTTTEGSGVGLAHSKKIVADMGGEISLNTKLSKGFELKVRIKK